MAAGGVVTGINPLCTPGEVATQLADTGARFVLTAPAFLPTARAAAGRAGGRARIVVLFLLDRVKELIKVKGFQVALAELEAGRAAQADLSGRVHRRHPHLAVGQDTAPATSRQRPIRGLRCTPGHNSS